MKKLNQKEWEIMKDALSVKQLETIQLKGMITLEKKEMIERLRESIKEIKEIVLDNLDNIPDEYKEMRDKLERNGKLHIKENKELIKKLEQDKEDYIVSFAKGGK